MSCRDCQSGPARWTFGFRAYDAAESRDDFANIVNLVDDKQQFIASSLQHRYLKKTFGYRSIPYHLLGIANPRIITSTESRHPLTTSSMSSIEGSRSMASLPAPLDASTDPEVRRSDSGIAGGQPGTPIFSSGSNDHEGHDDASLAEKGAPSGVVPNASGPPHAMSSEDLPLSAKPTPPQDEGSQTLKENKDSVPLSPDEGVLKYSQIPPLLEQNWKQNWGQTSSGSRSVSDNSSVTKSWEAQDVVYGQGSGQFTLETAQQQSSPTDSVVYTPLTQPQMTHLTPSSEVHMVSVSGKEPSHRIATAVCNVTFSNNNVVPLIRQHGLKKGDVSAVARTAGIMAVKRTSDIIPLCHPGLNIEGVEVLVAVVDGVDLDASGPLKIRGSEFADVLAKSMARGLGKNGGVRVACTVQCHGKTGVEMEALTGVMGAALTVVDMCKAVDNSIAIRMARVVRKEGGRSGKWIAWDWQ